VGLMKKPAQKNAPSPALRDEDKNKSPPPRRVFGVFRFVYVFCFFFWPPWVLGLRLRSFLRLSPSPSTAPTGTKTGGREAREGGGGRERERELSKPGWGGPRFAGEDGPIKKKKKKVDGGGME
jgi:hypothetical protein